MESNLLSLHSKVSKLNIFVHTEDLLKFCANMTILDEPISEHCCKISGGLNEIGQGDGVDIFIQLWY